MGWISRFIMFHNNQYAEKLGEREVRSFLSDLAVQEQVSANTQNQALNTLALLYNQVTIALHNPFYYP